MLAAGTLREWAVLPLIFGAAALVHVYMNDTSSWYPKFRERERQAGFALLGIAVAIWLVGLLTNG